jgi:hypothetical protein
MMAYLKRLKPEIASMSREHFASIMTLFYIHSKHSCTKDSLPANDTNTRTDTEHVTVTVAMLSDQLKSLGGDIADLKLRCRQTVCPPFHHFYHY